MVDASNSKSLTDEERAQYALSFCELCKFYPCELVGEYVQFRDSHLPASQNFARMEPVTPTLIIASDSKHLPEPVMCRPYHPPVDTVSFSYDEKELEKGCLMSYQHIYQVECGELQKELEIITKSK